MINTLNIKKNFFRETNEDQKQNLKNVISVSILLIHFYVKLAHF